MRKNTILGFVDFAVWMFLFFLSINSFATRNAPFTTAATISACPSSSVVIPVTVNDFTNICAITLRIEYNPTVATYVSYVGNPALTGLLVNSVSISPTLSKIMIVWAETTPVTLPANDTLVKITMNYMSGSTTLVFNNTAGGGGQCEYADETGNALNDIPTATYYTNGLISPTPEQLSLRNIDIGNNLSKCYYATQIITTAGDSTHFIVQNGGRTNIAAGQNIIFLPGTAVQSGGNLHASVSSTCISCDNEQLSNNSEQMQKESVWKSLSLSDGSKISFMVYPNPITTSFTLKMTNEGNPGTILVNLYDIYGNRILHEIISGETSRLFPISYLPPGIYGLCISTGDYSESMKIIKY